MPSRDPTCEILRVCPGAMQAFCAPAAVPPAIQDLLLSCFRPPPHALVLDQLISAARSARRGVLSNLCGSRLRRASTFQISPARPPLDCTIHASQNPSTNLSSPALLLLLVLLHCTHTPTHWSNVMEPRIRPLPLPEGFRSASVGRPDQHTGSRDASTMVVSAPGLRHACRMMSVPEMSEREGLHSRPPQDRELLGREVVETSPSPCCVVQPCRDRVPSQPDKPVSPRALPHHLASAAAGAMLSSSSLYAVQQAQTNHLSATTFSLGLIIKLFPSHRSKTSPPRATCQRAQSVGVLSLSRLQCQMQHLVGILQVMEVGSPLK